VSSHHKKNPAAPEPAVPANGASAAAVAEPVDPDDILPVRPARPPLTPERIAELSAVYRDVVLQDDDEAKQLARRIARELRRATHDELHPNCPEVEIDVPQLPMGNFVKINEVPYIGRVRVRRCVAQTILCLVHTARAVEAARLRDDGQTRDLDTGALYDRMRLIQEA
jgi:hypothetical protein